MRTEQLTEDQLRDRICVYVVGYIERVGKAPNLGILGRRFGKQVGRFGKDFMALLSGDRRFALNIIESGATLVLADPEGIEV